MNGPILNPASTPPILLWREEYKSYLLDEDWKEKETEGYTTDVGNKKPNAKKLH